MSFSHLFTVHEPPRHVWGTRCGVAARTGGNQASLCERDGSFRSFQTYSQEFKDKDFLLIIPV